MADIIPKIKLYLFLTSMLVLINLGIFASKQSMDFVGALTSIGTSFIPFACLIPIWAFPGNLPIEFLTFVSVVVGIFSGIITAIIGNTIWSLLPFINS